MSTVTQMVGTGEARESGVTKTDINDLMPQVSGVLSTARNPATRGPPSALVASTLVDYKGMQVTLRDAVRHGIVRVDAQGNYHDIDASPAAAAEAPEQPAAEASAEDAPVAFEPQQEAQLEQFASLVEPTIQAAVVAQVIAGGIDNVDLAQAHASNMDPTQFRASVADAMSSFQAQANSHVASKGINPAEFYAYILESEPALRLNAMRAFAAQRTPTVFNELIGKFLQKTTPDAAALNRGGFETKTENGVDMVKIPNVGWTSAKAAARAGLL